MRRRHLMVCALALLGGLSLASAVVAQNPEPAAVAAQTPEPVTALGAEDAYGNILLVNIGLNVGYMLVGSALAVAAGHGIAHPGVVRGHGLGVVVQGLGLLVLDGIAYAGSRGRMTSLQALAERVGAGATPGSVDVTLLSLGVW